MVTNRDLADWKSWYPPRCKAHFVHLNNYCSTRAYDRRSAFDVLLDAEYWAVAPSTRGYVRGFSHDRVTREFTLTIKDNTTGEKSVVPLHKLVKIELMSSVPRKYSPQSRLNP